MSLSREFTYHYLNMEPEIAEQEQDIAPSHAPQRGGMIKSEPPIRSAAVSWLLMEDSEE